MLVKGARLLLAYVAARELWKPLKTLLWGSTNGESLAAYQVFAFHKRLLAWLLLHTYKRVVSGPILPSS